MSNPNQMPANAERSGGISQARFDRRLNLMNDLEEDFAEAGVGVVGAKAIVAARAAEIEDIQITRVVLPKRNGPGNSKILALIR